MIKKNKLKALRILLEDVEQLLQLQLGITREKWLVSDQLICNLHQVRISIYVGVSYEVHTLKSDVGVHRNLTKNCANRPYVNQPAWSSVWNQGES